MLKKLKELKRKNRLFTDGSAGFANRKEPAYKLTAIADSVISHLYYQLYLTTPGNKFEPTYEDDIDELIRIAEEFLQIFERED